MCLPSIRNPVVDKDGMSPVLYVLFSSLTLLVGHPACKLTYATYLLFQNR